MIRDLNLRILPQEAASESYLRKAALRELGIDPRQLGGIRVVRRSIDARQRQVMVNVTLRAYVDEPMAEADYQSINYQNVEGKPQAIVVGAGPAGLFAALRLIELGLRPIVLERGKDVHQRKRDIARISREHTVDPESNYSFGEGGAGAYSDGKLYTRSKKRGSVEKILNVLCQHGASTSILVDAHPHIGTDRLPRVIENIRTTIIDCGGEVHFQTRVTDLIIENGVVRGVQAERVASEEVMQEMAYMGPVILATGHSARDVYRMMYGKGLSIEAKGIAVGVRLEHPSHLIDQIQYHSRDGRGQWLPAAEYSYVQQVQDRGVYSFCMCPGGFVVPAATGPEQVVVNGMSPSNRGSKWSNSGMVVELHPDDISSDIPEDMRNTPLAMMAYQEQLERLCWQQGGYRQTAPAQRMHDFVNNRLSYDLPASSYAPGIISSPLHFWMPPFVVSRLQEGFRIFGRRSKGFLTNEAIVIGVETRTSAPVRMRRDAETLQLLNIKGLYPCGEGAGYAGGIVSAAIDGERCAEACATTLSLT
ncbi:MAG: FAD-binding protein [Bacteroidaceae bacterium]|nr:FAD-binding protein [Bacteroidaceae bacterium]